MKQERLSRHTRELKHGSGIIEAPEEKSSISTWSIDIDMGSFKEHPLWSILVETTKRSPLYPGLVGYIREEILPKDPSIRPRELASKLSISVGEALVILDSLKAHE